MASSSGTQNALDSLAIGASGLCLVHCLVLPTVIVLLPSLAAILTFPEEFHLWALAAAVPSSLLALIAGFHRHRSYKSSIVVLPGLMLLAVGALAAPSEGAETAMTVAGALLLAIGHLANWRALRRPLRPVRAR